MTGRRASLDDWEIWREEFADAPTRWCAVKAGERRHSVAASSPLALLAKILDPSVLHEPQRLWP